jgi:DNA-binding NarL/FixJ family response regulator
MSSSSKHVIFYCDDCSLLEPVISVFRTTQPAIAVATSSSIKDLLSKVRTSKPEMILMYLHDPKQSYVEVLKEIREQVDFSTIEVIIYRELPDNKELQESFKRSFSKKIS